MDSIIVLAPLLKKAHDVDGPFLEGTSVTIGIWQIERFGLQPIMFLFQCAKKSKLHLTGCLRTQREDVMESIVQQIQNAPFDTFNEISVKLQDHLNDTRIERILRSMSLNNDRHLDH